MVFISAISWPSVLLVGETGVPEGKNGPVSFVRILCVSCDQCCQCLCVVHSSLPLWIFVTFIYVRCNLKKNETIGHQFSNQRHAILHSINKYKTLRKDKSIRFQY